MNYYPYTILADWFDRSHKLSDVVLGPHTGYCGVLSDFVDCGLCGRGSV